jgi:phage/plasmid-associated DNA primase
MDTRIVDILKQNSVPGSEQQTNFYTKFGPSGNWYIPPENIPRFWQEYCDVIYSSDEGECVSSVYQRSLPEMPFFVNATMKFAKKIDNACYYDDKFLPYMIHLYQNVLNDMFITDDASVSCVLLDNKKPYTEGKVDCVSFAMWFPYLLVPIGKFKKIHEAAIKKITACKVMTHLRAPLQNELEDMLGVVTSGFSSIPLYRSMDNPGKNVPDFYGLYPRITEKEITTCDFIDTSSLDDFFVPSNHSIVQKYGILGFPDKFTPTRTSEYWLPVLLSADFWSIPAMEKASSEEKKVMEEDQGNDDLLEKFTGMLDIKKRTANLHYFIEIGKSLYNIFHGTAEGIDKWKELVPDNDQTLFDICEKYYGKFQTVNYNTLKTIAWFAREDNPVEYKRWHDGWMASTLGQAISTYDTDIAKCFYSMFWLEYIYRGKNWYEFVGHRWVKNNMGPRKRITDEMIPMFERYLNSIIMSEIAPTQNVTKAEIKNNKDFKMKSLNKVIERLKTNSHKMRIVNEITQFFSERDDFSPMDTDPELLGVANGIIQIFEKDAIFRPGKPEDYITKTTGIPYVKNLTADHKTVIKLDDWIGKVFVDKELRHHFWKLSASKLRGRNQNKILEIWTGCGNNSKSMVVKLFEMTLGDNYCIKFPNSVLTSTKQGSGPNPELAQAKGAKLAFLQEPSSEVPLRTDELKKLTGGDSLFARNCNDDGGKFAATFKTVLMCNQPPFPSEVDKATMDRFKFLPFFSIWAEDCPTDKEEQYRKKIFKLQNDFEIEISDMARAFLWRLVAYYRTYVDEGLKNPECVKDFTAKYWANNDPLDVFIRTHCEKVPLTEKGLPDKSAKIPFAEFASAYKAWFEPLYSKSNFKVPLPASLMLRLNGFFGDHDNRTWYGWKMVSEQ